jgi:hypothetical protein
LQNFAGHSKWPVDDEGVDEVLRAFYVDENTRVRVEKQEEREKQQQQQQQQQQEEEEQQQQQQQQQRQRQRRGSGKTATQPAGPQAQPLETPPAVQAQPQPWQQARSHSSDNSIACLLQESTRTGTERGGDGSRSTQAGVDRLHRRKRQRLEDDKKKPLAAGSSSTAHRGSHGRHGNDGRTNREARSHQQLGTLSRIVGRVSTALAAPRR